MFNYSLQVYFNLNISEMFEMNSLVSCRNFFLECSNFTLKTFSMNSAFNHYKFVLFVRSQPGLCWRNSARNCGGHVASRPCRLGPGSVRQVDTQEERKTAIQGRLWPDTGPIQRRSWADTGPIQGRLWPYTGPMQGRSWAGLADVSSRERYAELYLVNKLYRNNLMQ